MMRKAYLLFFLLVMLQCTPDKSGEKESQTESVAESTPEPEKESFSEPIKEDSVVQEQPDIESKYLKVIISAYDQHQSLIETIIRNDSIIKVEKNAKTGIAEKTILSIKVPGILTSLEPYLDRHFKRSNEFYGPRYENNKFTHIETLTRDSVKVHVSFRNSKTLGLDSVLNILNTHLPQSEGIVVLGEYIKDTFVSPDQISTWDQLMKAATYTSNEFDIDEIDKNKYVRIDSTVFGKHLYKSLYIKSAYILAVEDKIGSYYPCIIFEEAYESDDVFSSVSLVMLDSALEEKVNHVTITSVWHDFNMKYASVGEVDSTNIAVTSRETYDCKNKETDLKRLQLNEHYRLTELGQIQLVRVDTLDKQVCM